MPSSFPDQLCSTASAIEAAALPAAATKVRPFGARGRCAPSIFSGSISGLSQTKPTSIDDLRAALDMLRGTLAELGITMYTPGGEPIDLSTVVVRVTL